MNTNIILCKTCGRKLTGKQQKYCSTKCKNASSNSIHQVYEAQQARGIKRKIEFLKLMGGRCRKCGYNRNISALAFHHTNPALKNFEITIREFSNNRLSVLEAEVAKCEVLCHNCHSEYHYPQCNGLL